MITTGVIVAGLGLLLVLASWVTYMATVPSGKVPLRPVGHLLAQALGGAAGVAGLGLAATDGGLWFSVPLGGLAATMAGLFFYLYSVRKTPSGRLTVAVGQPLRPFTALTPEGVTFDSASLKGRRTLLKFFRGHW